MKWRRYPAFVALLRSVTPECLLAYAASYQAFIRDRDPQSTLTITEILATWTREMHGERRNAALDSVRVAA
jgi:hypothetical protein